MHSIFRLLTYRALLLAAAFAIGAHAHSADAPARPINLLFIITDQQRWDTLGCMGNTIIHTPNLDRIAKEGARFTRMYSSCPVCVPARTVILTGHSCETNSVITNNDLDRTDLPTFETFDQILIKYGWHGEYHGKYHSPYKYALDYQNAVRWVNGKTAAWLTRGNQRVPSVLEIHGRACAQAPAPAR